MVKLSLNRLKGSRCYISGPIDRAEDFGYGWRNEITPILQSMGVIVVNPLSKPLKGYDETKECILERKLWKKNREFEKLAALRFIRNIDLRLVDCTDFSITYLDMDSHPFGTIEEAVLSNRQKKANLVWVKNGLENCPDWLFWMLPLEHLFDNREDLIQYLYDIDEGKKEHKRFIFFDFDKKQ